MTLHMCGGLWVDGKVSACEHHRHRGASAPDVSPFDDRRTRLRIDGVAETGEISPKGTVEHTDYWSGRMAVTAKPATINVVLSKMPWFRDRYVYRDGGWVEKTTGKKVAWLPQAGSPRSKLNSNSSKSRTGSSPRKRTGPTTPTSEPNSNRYGVSIGSTTVDLSPAQSNPPV